MTDKLRKAAEIALEALEWSHGGEPMPTKELEAMNAIRQALAEWTPDDTDTVIDRGAWDDVPDATKWVDELRGDEPNTDVVEPVAYVHLEGWLSEILWAEDAFSDTQFDGMVPLYTAPPKPDLLNQKCCGCGRSGGYALYCGWCWNKGN